MTEFGDQQYQKYVANSCLIPDLEFAFVGQIQAKLRQEELMSEDKNENERADDEFPLVKWQVTSVYDEPEDYS
eukprot:CAMPEP_0170453308 /NCGR_PEP_ID=MMETSP0123-20130129/1929_1 /TAXON_ID=182087 /ORGANISM="Favella ehrenbergii, Strain Fehren 1" /LENGTH=72 /DNA_ID=CAMNT_0010715629 /DNA_START=1732 /DNA_END=1950 /DNA_ORIENTATION=+